MLKKEFGIGEVGRLICNQIYGSRIANHQFWFKMLNEPRPLVPDDTANADAIDQRFALILACLHYLPAHTPHLDDGARGDARKIPAGILRNRRLKFERWEMILQGQFGRSFYVAVVEVARQQLRKPTLDKFTEGVKRG